MNKTTTKGISQSIMKDWLAGACHYYLRYYWHDFAFKGAPTQAMKAGLYFESELLGATADGKAYEPDRKGDGNLYAYLNPVKEFLPAAKEQLKKVFEIIQVQPMLSSGDLTGHVDAIAIHKPSGKEVVLDVKWCNDELTKRFGYYEWIYNKYQRTYENLIQAAHYSLITEGKMPFVYFIASAIGEIEVIQVAITPATIDKHRANIEAFKADIKAATPCGNFSKCNICPAKEICSERTENINLKTIEI